MTVGAPAAHEKEKTVDCSSPGKTQPGFCSKLSIHLTRQKESGQEPGNAIISTEQADPEKASPKEEGDPEEEEWDEIALNKCRADFSLWITEASSCPGEETERAHSSLDNILEGVLGPVADSQELHEKLPDPIQSERARGPEGQSVAAAVGTFAVQGISAYTETAVNLRYNWIPRTLVR
ncbi:hypothetical protein JRQ81_008098 [Phrynocephalus forsythii]|uniref:Uncharacterized protein n=1 Tax=Phrynocephalus forsythii TaxID=171643 RepID=A0A9Q1AT53_9SAUR|nr:hypothetical protein JRQ81_008098 [Phrynocephalus forsythii]